MLLFLLRGLLMVLVAAVTALYLLPNQWGAGLEFEQVALILLAVLGLTGTLVAVDLFTPRKKLSAMSGVFLGLIAGLVAAYALSFVVDLIGVLVPLPRGWSEETFGNLLQGVKVVIGLITCYVGISLVLQTKDDFRFVIPYVEFAKEIRGSRPTILDTSVIVDGRILDMIETRLMQGVIIIPKFVLNELQTIADSADKLRRARGRRGLDVLQKLQDGHIVEVLIDETEAEGANVDQKLISLAQRLAGRVMTNDYNLNKIATLRGVDVINLNDLAKALRPVVLPGEQMQVKLVKVGESPTQGVGYLDDGTMVVVENGRGMIGDEVDLTVTSTLQTSAGRMIFGRLAGDLSGGSRAGDSAMGMESGHPISGSDAGPAGQGPKSSHDSSAGISRASARNPRRSR
jgi:uncharacterized protein YacL